MPRPPLYRALVVVGVVLVLAIVGVLLVTRPFAPDVPTSVASRCVAAPPAASATLADDQRLTDVARMLVSSAENSSLDWEKQYGYIEYDVEGNAAENRGYTAGIVGFTSKTHDMLQLVQAYTTATPDNPLTPFLPALRRVDGTASTDGLGQPFVAAWKQAAATPAFQKAQRDLADSMYLAPAVRAARTDGLGRLGQFVYYDALVMHGPGDDALSFGGIRAAAVKEARPPSAGGDETAYLRAFLDARRTAMEAEEGHRDTSRVDAQEGFLTAGNLSLTLPLSWSVYGDHYALSAQGEPGC